MHEIEKHCMFFKRSMNLFFKTSNAFQSSPLSFVKNDSKHSQFQNFKMNASKVCFNDR